MLLIRENWEGEEEMKGERKGGRERGREEGRERKIILPLLT